MSLHISKYQAMVEASNREIAAAEKSSSRQHSSGFRYERWGVRRKLFLLWEPYRK